MHLLVSTDAWLPQVNGVVTTLGRLRDEVQKRGFKVTFITPQHFRTIAMPGYNSIPLALARSKRIGQLINESQPDWIHISTEGPIGWATRRFCLSNRHPFTTSYHTKFPEYLSKYTGLPTSLGYAWERTFHRPSCGVMVATPSLEEDLRAQGFNNLMRWSRGVDLDTFKPISVRLFGSDPVFLYVGRVSQEKNIEGFLDTDLPGRKVVVGDGPNLCHFKQRYPDVYFAGEKKGADLARHYASADVFVFPSRTDTFGLVLLEAMAAGLPVAAYPVTGPVDIVEDGVSGSLNENLELAARAALKLSPDAARTRAAQFTWKHSAAQFIDNIELAKIIHGRRRSTEHNLHQRHVT